MGSRIALLVGLVSCVGAACALATGPIVLSNTDRDRQTADREVTMVVDTLRLVVRNDQANEPVFDVVSVADDLVVASRLNANDLSYEFPELLTAYRNRTDHSSREITPQGN